jgi:hypothetical protein
MDEGSVVRERARLLRRSQALSVAFARRFQRRILLVVDDTKALFNPYTRDHIDHIVKVFVVVDDATLLDVTGKHDRVFVEGRYLRSNASAGSYRLIDLRGEEQLASFVSSDWDYSLSPVSETEIDAAFYDFLERFPEYERQDQSLSVHGKSC